MPTPIVLFGGDRRHLVCAHLLADAGYAVTVRGTGDGTLDTTAPLDACTAAVFPLPYGRGDLLHAPLWNSVLSLSQYLAKLSPACHLFVGRADDAFRCAAGTRPVHDYEAHEPLAIAGAVATAEGALAVAMDCLPCTLWQTEVAVIGFGRIAKVLAHRLQGLGARVTIFARKETDRAWAAAYGYRAFSTTDLAPLSHARVIFNTAPALLLTKREVAFLSPSTLYIELASTSGIDTFAAREFEVRVELALGLPGKQSPETAGRALAGTLLTLFEKEGIAP